MDKEFIPMFSIYDAMMNESDDYDIVQPVRPEDLGGRKVKVKPDLGIPCYVKNRFNLSPTKINNKIKFNVPNFNIDRDTFQKEIDYGNKNYQLFQKYMLDYADEKYWRETKSIEDAMAMPYITLRTIFLKCNIHRKVFKEKTFMSDATYDRIMKDKDFVPDIKTLTNICWTFQSDYLMTEELFKSYGIYLDAKTPQIRAYKHVLKYMTFVDIETVNRFLKKNKVPLFQKIPK